MPGRFWEPWEDEAMRKWYGKEPIADIMALLDRSTSSIHNRAKNLGIAKPNVPESEVEKYVLRLHPLGYSDPEIAAEMRKDGVMTERHRVSVVRQKHGLRSNKASDRQRQKIAEKTLEQCREAGVRNLGELRAKRFGEFAVRHGWPDGLSVRETQVCEALWRLGPMNRRNIAKAIGMNHEGPSRWLLKCGHRQSTSLTAALLRKGLVVRLPRGERITGKGKGHSRDLYALKPGVRPHGQDVKDCRRGSTDGPTFGDPVHAADASLCSV